MIIPHRRAMAGLALALLLTLAPAAASAQAAHAPAAAPVVELPAGLEAVLRNYETAWRNRDAAALAALFTDDGFVLRPGRPLVRGTEAIRVAYAGAGGPLVLRPYGFAFEGGVGYIVGGFAMGPAEPDAGKFVLALRQVPGRGWLIAADMDNGNSR